MSDMPAKRIHILGIAGTFMGGVAALARELGFEVEGSDQNIYPPMSTQLEQLGIALKQGYLPRNISTDCDEVIVGNALSRGNAAVEHVLDAALEYCSGAQWLSEAVATFGLLLTMILGIRHRPTAIPALVASYIFAAYWFTASTSFANPAVTIARALTQTFAGIRPQDVGGFVIAQLAGLLVALGIARLLLGRFHLLPVESPMR